MQDIGDQLTRAAHAAHDNGVVRACFLGTRDRNHTLATLVEVCLPLERRGMTILRYTPAGRYRLDDQRLLWVRESRELSDTAGLLRVVGECTAPAVIVLEDALMGLQDEGGDPRARMLLVDLLSRANGVGLLLIWLDGPDAARRFPEKVRDQVVKVTMPYPRRADLERIVTTELLCRLQRSRTECPRQQLQETSSMLATSLTGLTFSAARDAVQEALADESLDVNQAYQRLETRKRQHLAGELEMRVLDTRDADLPEGLDVLTGYITMIAPRLRVTGPERARGVLLVGPPGTGKTMLARAIGRLVDLPVVEFRISALMTSLLGETEQRFAQAFATLEAMAPNVVFVDEIEKAFGDQSERDGGTMMRCTGALLSWLSDNQNPNFIVATSNNLSRMGEIGMTMTRAERFDASFFVDVPAEAARRVMLTRWLGPGFFSSEIIGRLAADTPRFSGADLRSVVKIARMRAESAGRPLSEEDLQWEVARRRDRVQGLYDEFMPLRRWGAMYCDTASTHRDA